MSKLNKAINKGLNLYQLCSHKNTVVKVMKDGLYKRSNRPNKYSWSRLAVWEDVDLRSLKA